MKLNYGLISFDLILIVSVQLIRNCVRGHAKKSKKKSLCFIVR